MKSHAAATTKPLFSALPVVPSHTCRVPEVLPKGRAWDVPAASSWLQQAVITDPGGLHLIAHSLCDSYVDRHEPATRIIDSLICGDMSLGILVWDSAVSLATLFPRCCWCRILASEDGAEDFRFPGEPHAGI